MRGVGRLHLVERLLVLLPGGHEGASRTERRRKVVGAHLKAVGGTLDGFGALGRRAALAVVTVGAHELERCESEHPREQASDARDLLHAEANHA